MTSSLARIVLATLIVGAAAGTAPAEADGYVGLEVSNHGVSFGVGSSSWGIWGSSWDTEGLAVGFSATLAGYGEWVRVGGLGRVWRPWVAAGWQPYTHGRWVWTSLGWTWVAYEPWGWVPHHYGNWAFSTVGWVWSPGYAYHPGNVLWVSSGIHVGWYPCAPAGWSHFNRGIYHGWNRGYAAGHHDGYARGYWDGWRDARYATWVPWSRVTADNVAHHAVDHGTATHQAARSRVVAMATPPTRSDIEGRTGRAVPEARVVERRVTIDGRDVRVVRPEGQTSEIRRHGAETVDHALAPVARKRAVASEARSVVPSATGSPRPERESRSTTKRLDSNTSSNVHRSSPATHRSPRLPTTRDSEIEPARATERPTAAHRNRSGSDSRAKTSVVGTRERATSRVTNRAVSRRAPVTVEPQSRTRTSARPPSPKPQRTSKVTRQVRRAPVKKDASETQAAHHRKKADPSDEKRRKGRRTKN